MGRGRQFWADGMDSRSGLQVRSAGEWKAYYYLKQRSAQEEASAAELEGLMSLAETDLREAECFHKAISVWSSDDWRPEAYDADLFNLVAMLYISQLLDNNETEFRACCASVRLVDGTITEEVLRRLVEFCISLSSCHFDGFSDDMLAVEALEKIWLSSLEKNAEAIPGALQIVKAVVRSTYFLSLPRRDAEGPACATALACIRQRISQLRSSSEHKPELLNLLEEMESEVANFYRTEAVPFEDTDWEEYYRRSLMIYIGYPGFWDPEAIDNLLKELEPAGWGHLKCGQVKELLSALPKSRILQALVSQKPPKSVFLSHLLAVYDCTTHARLWLLKCHLAPYSAFRQLTYDVLGTNGGDAENGTQQVEALQSSLGFMERVPSFVEKLQRREAVHAYDEWSSAGKLGKRQGLVFPMKSPACREVLVPCYLRSGGDIWMLESLRHPLVDLLRPMTFWYESKLEVFVKDEERVRKYLDTPRFLELTEHIRDSRPVPESFVF